MHLSVFFFFQKSYKFVSNCLLCSFYWVGFRISLSLSAIFRDKIENYFSCPHLARQDRDYHMTILVFRDENEITCFYSSVSRQDRDFRKSFLVVDKKWSLLSSRILGMENSRWTLRPMCRSSWGAPLTEMILSHHSHLIKYLPGRSVSRNFVLPIQLCFDWYPYLREGVNWKNRFF